MAWRDGLAERARSVLTPAVWNHVEAGSGAEVTAREAEAAWGRVRFAPRVLRDVSTVDIRTSLLGSHVATPVAIAPSSMQRAVHPDGERAVAVGAAAAGALHVVSSNAGHRFADLAGGAPWWLQLYLPPDRDQALPVIEGAVAAGARALVLTVDTPVPGAKPRVAGDDWTGVDVSWFRANFPEPAATRQAMDLTPADIGWLRNAGGLPVVVKGVLRGDDARRCVDEGADAVWVSNHGGRQLDRAVATARVLPTVAEAVAADVEVYVDGGVRSGLDVLAALSLGAGAVFIGRPVLHALAVGGSGGVSALLDELSAELREALVLAGCPTPHDALGIAVAGA